LEGKALIIVWLTLILLYSTMVPFNGMLEVLIAYLAATMSTHAGVRLLQSVSFPFILCGLCFSFLAIAACSLNLKHRWIGETELAPIRARIE